MGISDWSSDVCSSDLLPQDPQVWGAGKVIITTRDTNLRNTKYIKSENVISVEVLSPTEALILFSKILYNCDPQMLTVKQKQEFDNFLRSEENLVGKECEGTMRHWWYASH